MEQREHGERQLQSEDDLAEVEQIVDAARPAVSDHENRRDDGKQSRN